MATTRPSSPPFTQPRLGEQLSSSACPCTQYSHSHEPSLHADANGRRQRPVASRSARLHRHLARTGQLVRRCVQSTRPSLQHCLQSTLVDRIELGERGWPLVSAPPSAESCPAHRHRHAPSSRRPAGVLAPPQSLESSPADPHRAPPSLSRSPRWSPRHPLRPLLWCQGGCASLFPPPPPSTFNALEADAFTHPAGHRRGHPLPLALGPAPDPHGDAHQAPSQLLSPHRSSRTHPRTHKADAQHARAQNISTTTGSKDLQTVSLTLRVMFRPDIRHLATIYRSLGTTYDERVLPSIGNEVLKATVAQFDAAELITQREVVSARIREDLLKRAGEFNIILEDVSLVRSLPLTSFRAFGRALALTLPSLPSLSLRTLTDAHDVRQGLHAGRRAEADRAAGGRARQVHCRAGASLSLSFPAFPRSPLSSSSPPSSSSTFERRLIPLLHAHSPSKSARRPSCAPRARPRQPPSSAAR